MRPPPQAARPHRQPALCGDGDVVERHRRAQAAPVHEREAVEQDEIRADLHLLVKLHFGNHSTFERVVLAHARVQIHVAQEGLVGRVQKETGEFDEIGLPLVQQSRHVVQIARGVVIVVVEVRDQLAARLRDQLIAFAPMVVRVAECQ